MKKTCSPKTRIAAGIAAVLLAPQLAGAATAVAPYFETWNYGGGFSPKTLMEAKANGGVMAATMAFGISGGGCTLGGGLEAVLGGAPKTDVANFRAAGGRVILSFGGASGTYLEAACSDDGMYNVMKNVIDSTGAHAIDFDIEGNQAGNSSLDTRRNNVTKRLQATYPDLYVSYTLQADVNGLDGNALRILRGANAAGINVAIANMMTMDYYDGNSGQSMGSKAIAAANAEFNQLKGIFTGRTDAQIWAMEGNTPMIGVNDDQSENFHQSDASALTAFAQQKGIGLIAYWALQRDMPGGSDYNNYSLDNTVPYEFYKIFAGSVVNPGGPANGTYTITSAFSGKCLAIAGASTADGAQLEQDTCNGKGAQLFKVRDMGGGWYRLINKHSGKAIDVAAASTADGAKVQQYTDNGTLAQRFSIAPGSDPTTWTITNQNSGKCLDLADWSTNDGAKIQQWTCAGTANQAYHFNKQ
jgi:chitinase